MEFVSRSWLGLLDGIFESTFNEFDANKLGFQNESQFMVENCTRM